MWKLKLKLFNFNCYMLVVGGHILPLECLACARTGLQASCLISSGAELIFFFSCARQIFFSLVGNVRLDLNLRLILLWKLSQILNWKNIAENWESENQPLYCTVFEICKVNLLCKENKVLVIYRLLHKLWHLWYLKQNVSLV